MNTDTPTATTGSSNLPSDLNLPLTDVPFFSRVPEPGILWSRFLTVVWILIAYNMLDGVTAVMMNFWYLESFSLESVFWTNFNAGAIAFFVTLAVYTLAITLPAFVHNVQPWARKATIHLGLMAGVISGYIMAYHYRDFLVLFRGEPFGKTDPIYGNDIGFYVFQLPGIWLIWWVALFAIAAGLFSSIRCAAIRETGKERPPVNWNWVRYGVRHISTNCTLVFFMLFGTHLAIAQWLYRYDLLLRENKDQMIYNGAQYMDVTGLFSTLNDYQLTSFVIFAVTASIVAMLAVFRRYEGPTDESGRVFIRRAILACSILLAVDFSFKLGLWVRDTVFVNPDEPIVQLPYIDHHIKATREAYGIDKIEVVKFLSGRGTDPIPDIDKLLASAAAKNVPLWPGYVARLETHIDPQHAERVLQTRGDTVIYGPTVELFRQQQKLRMYYDIMDVKADRYPNGANGGEKEMFVVSTRELPLHSPQPWLYQWGQRSLWYTHGYGLVAAWASQINSEGDPIYSVGGIPPKSDIPQLNVKNPYIYFGEGTKTMFFSNLKDMQELGHPTDEEIVQAEFPKEVQSGVKLDSLLKRLVIGWRSSEEDYPLRFWEVLMSSMITDETRAHYWRTPLDRLDHVAPFLHFDTNTWPVATEDSILWMANAMTYTNEYPYSQRRILGDKAQVRTEYPRLHAPHNYVRDAVKATVDASTGEIRFYKFADEPIINTWAKIYPKLFIEKSGMPEVVKQHMQYPLQMFHRQFDDIYNQYHMTDPLVFYNMEDLWDDADEVLGPVVDKGESITFSFEPYLWMTDTGNSVFPESSEKTQFVMSMPFTPEKSLNLRSIGMVYQDGDDYGKLFSLEVPKGGYTMSPEQADAAIDQEPEISEQISWWNRLGTDVIRGHTTPLIIENELIYVEPLYIRSQQEPLSELKKVCVVFRGKVRMASTFEEALRSAVAAYSEEMSKTKPAMQTAADVNASPREAPKPSE